MFHLFVFVLSVRAGLNNGAFYGCSSLTDIQFKGTVEEWKAIQKKYLLYLGSENYTVTCTDGTIDKEGNVTYFEQ